MFWSLFTRRMAHIRRPAARKRPTARPGVECLERREVPTLTMTLKIDGIVGDRPGGEIAIDSFSFAVSGTGPVQFHFTMKENRVTPALLRAEVTGQHFGSVALIERAQGAGGTVEVLRYTLSDVMVTSLHTLGGTGGTVPEEEITLSYGRVQRSVPPKSAAPTTGLAGAAAKQAHPQPVGDTTRAVVD